MQKAGSVPQLRPVQENIQTIVELEEKARNKRSSADRLSDAISGFAGSTAFVIFNAVFFAGWMLINFDLLPIKAFDPYPFTFLTLVVSLEAIFLSTFVLISQNRMSRQADQRAHLNLQVDMLAEQEMTKVLEMLQQICRQLGLEDYMHDPRVHQMMQETRVETLASDLEEQLPNG